MSKEGEEREKQLLQNLFLSEAIFKCEDSIRQFKRSKFPKEQSEKAVRYFEGEREKLFRTLVSGLD